MASSTIVVETKLNKPQAPVNPPEERSIPLAAISAPEHDSTTSASPNNAFSGTGNVVDASQRWNHPAINKYRLLVIFFAFMNFGMNDASYGALIPYIEQDYHLSYLVVSLVFLSPFSGYTVAALFSDRLHRLAGRRGVAYVGPACKLVTYIVISIHPPYPVVVVFLALAGIGNGLLDAAWNTWVGQMGHANEILGLLHGCYGLGATISPLISTTMITRGGLGWWTFYYIMAGLLALELVLGTVAFWTETGTKYRDTNRTDGEEKGMTRRALKQKVTWICSIYFLAYVGTEVSLGGWIVIFMNRVRQARPFSSGMTATGFWLGITLGRVILGFVTSRIGERPAVITYLLCATGLELIFWLVPQFIVSAVAIALVGFFIGPLFPSGVVMAAKLLPTELHVAALGFSTAFGGGGAAILPFVVGTIVSARGVQTLQPIVLALLVLLLGIWIMFPRLPRHAHQA